MSLFDCPRWLFMWLIALALFLGCKGLTWRRVAYSARTWRRSLAYWLAWPGMDAQAFFSTKTTVVPPTWGEWLLAGTNTLAGVLLFWIVAPLVAEPLGRGWLGMIGLVLLLHFGVFHVLSCLWRAWGLEAAPLMNWPLASRSLSEFWGRRWNTAFRDLTYRYLFRPLLPWVGPRWALALGFLVSGLVHELVISVPAGAGFGGPTAYFCLQAAGLLTEARLGKSRLFTFAVVVLPVMALFHPPFVHAIVLPMMEALGANRGD